MHIVSVHSRGGPHYPNRLPHWAEANLSILYIHPAPSSKPSNDHGIRIFLWVYSNNPSSLNGAKASLCVASLPHPPRANIGSMRTNRKIRHSSKLKSFLSPKRLWHLVQSSCRAGRFVKAMTNLYTHQSGFVGKRRWGWRRGTLASAHSISAFVCGAFIHFFVPLPPNIDPTKQRRHRSE